jgi:hypothetical protein
VNSREELAAKRAAQLVVLAMFESAVAATEDKASIVALLQALKISFPK